ncbi:hypothetical protein [Wenjunlia tyrosinilytica]|uniref:Uncharacterized protein n=1 Tax=Wenjunlia tyrosinilytica TaxID=1544741 RepID=A0A917ZL65_9ACTN|nr:hypothetical protein [Wenjunlia tyrosinilytica]GGO83855.1 hypothetical protein GCM10012280_13980 [Wenjunlia tyrosinilytica]
MRMLLRASMDTERANEAFKNGTMGRTIEKVAQKVHPEAAYFTTIDGKRTALFVFDMQDSSQMPSIAEPLFSEFGAYITFEPVMNSEDLAKGLGAT